MADIQDNPPTNKYAVKEKVIPQLLKERLENRKKSKLFFIIYIVFNTILAIIGGLYFDCYYYTRNYIFNGDEFWEFYEKKQLDNKAVPLNAMLSGIICILTFCFNLMNLIVIGLYVIFGGVRDRLIFANYVNLFMQIFLMIYSIFPIALYGAIVFLNIFLIVFALANLGLALGLFVFLRKVGIFEREKMLPLAFLKLHAKEYTEEYNKKLKEVIGGSHLPAEIEPRVNN